MEKGKYILSAFLILVVLTSSIYFVLNDNIRIDIQETRSIFKVLEDGKWVISGIEYVNLFDGTAKMRASERDIQIETYLNDTIVTRTAQYKNNILVVEKYMFQANTSDVELFPVSHSIEVIGADRPERPYILQYEVQRLLYDGETIRDILSPQSFGYQMKIEWEDGNYYSRIYKYSSKDEGKLTIKYKIDSDKFNKNVRLFDPPENMSVTLISPTDNFITDTNSNNFSTQVTSDGLGIQNVSLYVKQSGGSYEVTDTISFNTTNYNLDIYADSLTESGFEINNVNATKISEGVWRINSSESDYDTQRAQVMKTLFHGTNGADPRATSTYITNPTKVIVNNPQDDGMRGYYARVSFNYRTTGYYDTGMNGSEDNVTLWAYHSCSQSGNGCTAPQTYKFNGTTVLTMPTSSNNIVTDYIGTTTYQNFYTPISHRMTGGSVSFGTYNTNRWIVLTKGNMSFSYTRTFCGTGCGETYEDTDFLVDKGFPVMTYNGLSNFTMNFTEDIINTAIWNIEVCDAGGDCKFGASNYSISLDGTNPIIDITFPQNTSYITNVSTVNFTLIEDYPSKCWYSKDLGATNSTPITAINGSNYMNITSDLLQNSIHVYCNDTLGNMELSNIYYNLKAIEYASNSDSSNPSTSGVGPVFINVTINPMLEFKNISFIGYNLTSSTITQYLLSNFSTLITNTTLTSTTNPFYWDALVYDLDNISYSLTERYKGSEVINFSLEGVFDNIIVELGADIDINSTSNIYNVYLDIDHPDYGNNYSVGFLENNLNLIINWFRKTLFASGNSSEILNFTAGYGTDENKTFNLSAHQYDEIVNVSLNITGTNNPLGVAFYKANSTEYDRVFFGNLTTDGYIQQNKLVDKSFSPYGYNTTQDLSWDNEGTKYLYFYLDNAARLVSFLINVSSSSYGFYFLDTFNTTSYADIVLTNASYNGLIRPGFDEVTEFTYDNFSDASINDTLWIYPTDVNVGAPGGQNGYSRLLTSSILSDSLYSYIDLDLEPDSWDSCYTNNPHYYEDNYKIANTSAINLYAIDGVSFSFDYSFYYKQYSSHIDYDFGDCNNNLAIKIGGTSIWTPHNYECTTDADSYCEATELSPTNLVFNITRVVGNLWNVKISGTEHMSGTADKYCGNFESYTYWDQNLRVNTFDSCSDTNDTLSSNFNITVNPNSAVLYIDTKADASYTGWDGVGDGGCEGCSDITTWTKLYNVTYMHPNYQNNTWYYSTSIFDSSYNVPKVTPIVNYQTETGGGENSTLTFFLSGDNGDYWQNFVSEVNTPITNPGKHMKWSIFIELAEDGYTMNIPVIYNVSFQVQPSNLSNLTFDFGDDGTIDYVINGDFTPDNGTIQINLTSASLSNSFLDNAIVAQTHAVPLVISSDSAGLLPVEGIDLIYNPNPIFLNYTAIQNYLTSFGSGISIIQIILEASGLNSIVNLTDLRFDYAGGNDTIEILAHNEDYSQNVSRNITYYYSRWDYEWVPLGVEWMYFAPTKPTAQNVIPYGQTDDTPIINITNYGYGGVNADLSIYQDSSLQCVSTFMSTGNAKPLSSLWDGLINYWSFDFGVEDIFGGNNGIIDGAVQVDGEAQDGLIAWFKFDAEGDLQDYVNNYPASSSNLSTITWSSSGRYFGGYEFDNTDIQDKIKFGNKDVFEVGNHTFSIWVNPQSNAGAIYLFDHYNWRFTTSGGKYVFTVGRMENLTGPSNATGPSFSATAIDTLNVDEWTLLTGVYSPDPIGGNGYIQLYINGIIQETIDIEYQKIWIGYGDDEAQIGNSDHGAAIPYNGSVDDVRIYNKTLNSNEILALYERRLETPGNAYYFNGNNQSIDMGSEFPEIGSLLNFSYGAWVNPKAYKSGSDREDQMIIFGGRHGDQDTLSIQDGGQILFRRDDPELLASGKAELNVWTHIFVTYSYTNSSYIESKIYINGRLNASEIESEYSFGPSSTHWVGWESRFFNSFNGSIDELKVFNRTISDNEISELYNRSVNKYYDIKLLENWQIIDFKRPYLKTNDIYLWADYTCDYSTWRLFNPYIYFRQCVSGGSCSIDII